MKRLILVLLAAGALAASCTAIAHLRQLQPPPVPKPSHLTLPATSPSAPVAGGFQRGIDIDAYTYPGQNIPAAAAADVAFIQSLHANAVSVSFPFFMTGPSSSTVYGASSTPAPQQLEVIISAARRAGLYVSVRPLLDETNLGISRVHWTPADPAAWFRSYARFLRPYAQAAQHAGAHEFIVGTEFSLFATSPQWNTLDSVIRRVFHGTLACANNWTRTPVPTVGNCGRGVMETVDAYPPVHGGLRSGWEAYDQMQRRGTILTEVGIDAVAGAERAPYKHSWPGATLDPGVQARWFSAACHAAVKENLGGIYFWSIGLSAQPAAGPTLRYQGGWGGGAGAQAISRCFRTAQRSAR